LRFSFILRNGFNNLDQEIGINLWPCFGQLVFSAQAYTGGFPTPGLSPGLYTYRLRQPGVPDKFGKMVLVE
jgi:hypothetical protein